MRPQLSAIVAMAALVLLAGCGGDEGPTCGSGTQLVDGACVATGGPACGPGTTLDGGVCWLNEVDAGPGDGDADPATDTAADLTETTADVAETTLTCTPACSASEQCIAGVCEPLPPPDAWACAKSAFADGETCDCGCGAPDPDCAGGAKPVVGCKTAGACGADGTCPACVPSCTGLECGDDGCGGLCGTCVDPSKPACKNGICQACTPDCDGKDCGDDGCGGSCGTCGSDQLCKVGMCQFPTAEESCLGNCGGFASSGCACTADCGKTESCCIDVGVCGCIPDCSGKTCGDDGCGGACGFCGDGTSCLGGSCAMTGGCETSFCNGHGTCAAADVQCTCASGYAGVTCNQCASGLVGYPKCVAPCTDVAQCDDKDGCTLDICAENQVCIHPVITCNDGNACTDDVCDPVAGCVQTPNAAVICEDGNACTTGDICDAGTCVGGSAANCDDGNACSDDACEAPGGCVHTDHDGGCDDGDVCSTVDVCVNQTCTAAGSVSCDDGNACTNDLCNAKSGACSHVSAPAGGSCDDDDLCTAGDTCDGSGGCKSGAKVCALSVTSGLVAHYSAGQVGTLAYGEDLAVQVWQDQSGKGHDLGAILAEKAPKLDASGIHGRRGVRLTTAAGLQSAAFEFGSAVSVFVVTCTDASGGPGALLAQGGWTLGGSDGSVAWTAGGKGSGTSHLLSGDTCYVLAARAGAGNLDLMAIDSLSTGKTDAGTVTPGNQALTLGTDGGAGVVGEVLVYDRALTDDERDSVATYLRTAWGFAPPQPDFAWYDATDAQSVERDAAGVVQTWQDKSGLGRDAVAGQDAGPTWFAQGTSNGKPAIRFDGGNVRLQSAPVPTSSQLTVITVIELDKPQAWGNVFSQGQDAAFALRKTEKAASSLNWHIGANNDAPSLPFVSGQWQIVTAVQDGKTSTLYADPAAPQKTEQPNAIPNGNLALDLGNSANGGESMGGFLAEVRAYASALSRTDRAFIEATLKAKFGL